VRRTNIHEDLTRGAPVTAGSERAFGFVFTAVFVMVGAWPAIGGSAPRWWAFVLALAFLAPAIVAPRVLAPLNRAWLRLGALLHRIVTPLVMGLIFFTTVVPTGLIMRLMGRDLLGLKFDRAAESYWVPRDPPGPDPQTMRNQF